MKDLAIELENRPGALAELGEVLGRAGVSVEGGGAWVAGAALFAIGAICGLASKSPRVGGRTEIFAGLLLYNAAIPVLLAHSAMVQELYGIALWPAVTLHALLAVWCLACLLQAGRA